MGEISHHDIYARLGTIEGKMSSDDDLREERQKHLDGTLNYIKDALANQSELIQDIQKKQISDRNEMDKYKGFVGGVSLVISVLWMGFVAFRDSIMGLFGGR